MKVTVINNWNMSHHNIKELYDYKNSFKKQAEDTKTNKKQIK